MQSDDLRRFIPSPKEIVAHLDRTVVGQSAVKKKLAVAVTNHYLRLLDAEDRQNRSPLVPPDDLADVPISKSNVLLVGPTGTGKTLLAKSLAKMLNLPFAIGDATSLTAAGYVGEDVESLLIKLLRSADWDLKAAERGVVYIDEIDKIRRTAEHVSFMRDVSGEGVQQALLKMIEGSVCNVPPQGGSKHPEQQFIPIDTTNILFICGGTFDGLGEIIARRLGRGAFGFDPAARERRRDGGNLLRHAQPSDLEVYGLIPEFVGRLPLVGVLDDLGVDDLTRILTQPKDALLKQFKKLVRLRGADIEFTEGAIGMIAKIAYERGTGARGLRSVVEEMMEDVLFDPEPMAKYFVSEETVRGEEMIRRVQVPPLGDRVRRGLR